LTAGRRGGWGGLAKHGWEKGDKKGQNPMGRKARLKCGVDYQNFSTKVRKESGEKDFRERCVYSVEKRGRGLI